MKIEGKVIYVDIDMTLCISMQRDSDGEMDYNFSVPIQKNIDRVNLLFENNRIVLFTARGKRTGKIDWSEFTIKQMMQWGVKFHALDMNKPHFDVLIDDKAITNFDLLERFFFTPAGKAELVEQLEQEIIADQNALEITLRMGYSKPAVTDAWKRLFFPTSKHDDFERYYRIRRFIDDFTEPAASIEVPPEA